MWPLERTQSFSKIWASDLDFGPTWHIIEFAWDFIKTNILTKFHDNWTENVASRAYTSKKADDALRTMDTALSQQLTKWSGELKKYTMGDIAWIFN